MSDGETLYPFKVRKNIESLPNNCASPASFYVLEYKSGDSGLGACTWNTLMSKYYFFDTDLAEFQPLVALNDLDMYVC